MTVFVDLLNWIEGEGLTYFWGGFLVFIRIGAMLALLPVFGEQMLPARIRLAAAIAFSLIAAPLVVAPKDVGFAELGTEAVAGLMLGVGLRLMIIALQIAGSIAAQSTSLAQILGIQGADPAPAVSHFLVISGLALATVLDLHLSVIELILHSYDLMPIGRLPNVEDALSWGLAQVSQSFALGFSLAAPFVIGGLLYYAAIGAINRAMPTLMVAFIGAPALTGGAMVFLALMAPLIMAVWASAWTDWLQNPFGAGK